MIGVPEIATRSLVVEEVEDTSGRFETADLFVAQ